MMRHTKIILVLFLFATGFIQSCKKKNAVDGAPETPEPPSNPVYTSAYKYNLNVVYFVPADRQVNDDYHSRLSKILLNGQSFYQTWMKYWGYGDKTFGLLKDESLQLIKIAVVKGKMSQSSYPYEGGSKAMSDEIKQWFAANPTEQASDHFLVISAVNVTDPSAIQNSGVPFYGTGRWCYALDYPGMRVTNLGVGGITGSEASKWIGGMLHELGHGINLPHTGEWVSQISNPALGTSLMGGGNLTYGKSPTFLTHTSCATLNNNQLFTKVEKTFYGATSASVKTIYAKYENGDIIVSGKYLSTVLVSDISFNHRPVDNPGGYTAMTWVAKPVGADSFYIRMPVGEFRQKDNMAYEFSVILHHENGINTWNSYGYEFNAGIPVIDFGLKNEYDKTNWELIAFSSEESGSENGRALNILDNDPTSYWHSRWSTAAAQPPHSLTVDMKQLLTAKGFTLTQRNGQRKVKEVELLISEDNNNWENLGQYQLKDYAGQQVVNLPVLKTFRYFKIVINSAHDGLQYAALAEAGVLNE